MAQATPVAEAGGEVVYLVRANHIGRPAFATTLAGTKVWSAARPSARAAAFGRKTVHRTVF